MLSYFPLGKDRVQRTFRPKIDGKNVRSRFGLLCRYFLQGFGIDYQKTVKRVKKHERTNTIKHILPKLVLVLEFVICFLKPRKQRTGLLILKLPFKLYKQRN